MKHIICGIIYDNFGNILMGKRKCNYENGGKWEFPGGKLEQGESFNQCLCREWKEELNIDINIEKYLTFHLEGNYICHFIIGNLGSNGIYDFEMNAHDQLGLFHPNEIGLLNLFESDRELLSLLEI